MTTFPKNFFWGASISSHQTEGSNTNNWSVWEIRNAYHLAGLAERNKGWTHNWENVKDEATNPQNYISGKASDHYNKFREDFDIAKKLNLNALRFSIEWSRIEPEEGKFNEKELDFYRTYIDELRARNLEPFVTIWHWTVPIWFETLGGFQKKSNIKYFERFVQKLVEEFGERITYWITLNEPRIYVSESLLNGRWPPQKKSLVKYYLTLMHLAEAHRKAYKIIKKNDSSSEIGIAENMASYTTDGKFLDRLVRKIFAWYELRLIKGYSKYLDFIGLNYYFHRHVENFRVTKLSSEGKSSDLGWDLYPEGIHSPLMRLKSIGKPIIITENGLADKEDIHRKWFIEETLKHLERSILDGANVLGYLHWSLIDNFEWDSGFWPRFGLVEVDYKNNFKRKIRESAQRYSELIKISQQSLSD